ncbi:MarR family winged helix-turn-helix transcriptional regulator [Kineococcus rhizosphaerae]|uniref:DNA-binding MarR family transcriptional regulator n=1 Tax=Kineococcus rhizosphaerae TaxID=559628 RepID=A0A2T0QZH7_9ACTN|nr:MarR family transcriptional regulator [Kineococcus rhizosphaerae]PRY12071.1 DNA-binding MarR family transcriptional regulator [Kineococcus rhizosphaerae]
MTDTDGSPRATADAARALVGIAVRSLADALEHVTLTQYRVLVLVVTDGPTRSGSLADQVGVHPSSFTRLADRLVAGGWAVRTENAENRREVLLGATARGEELVAAVMRRREDEIATVLAHVTPRRRRSIELGMTAFARAVETLVASGDLPPNPEV